MACLAEVFGQCREAKVRYLKLTVGVKQKVLGLQVPVTNLASKARAAGAQCCAELCAVAQHCGDKGWLRRAVKRACVQLRARAAGQASTRPHPTFVAIPHGIDELLEVWPGLIFGVSSCITRKGSR